MLDDDTRNVKGIIAKTKVEYFSEITASYSWEKERELLNWSNYSQEFLEAITRNERRKPYICNQEWEFLDTKIWRRSWEDWSTAIIKRISHNLLLLSGNTQVCGNAIFNHDNIKNLILKNRSIDPKIDHFGNIARIILLLLGITHSPRFSLTPAKPLVASMAAKLIFSMYL